MGILAMMTAPRGKCLIIEGQSKNHGIFLLAIISKDAYQV
jgi:hypothetical protein